MNNLFISVKIIRDNTSLWEEHFWLLCLVWTSFGFNLFFQGHSSASWRYSPEHKRAHSKGEKVHSSIQDWDLHLYCKAKSKQGALPLIVLREKFRGQKWRIYCTFEKLEACKRFDWNCFTTDSAKRDTKKKTKGSTWIDALGLIQTQSLAACFHQLLCLCSFPTPVLLYIFLTVFQCFPFPMLVSRSLRIYFFLPNKTLPASMPLCWLQSFLLAVDKATRKSEQGGKSHVSLMSVDWHAMSLRPTRTVVYQGGLWNSIIPKCGYLCYKIDLCMNGGTLLCCYSSNSQLAPVLPWVAFSALHKKSLKTDFPFHSLCFSMKGPFPERFLGSSRCETCLQYFKIPLKARLHCRFLLRILGRFLLRFHGV